MLFQQGTKGNLMKSLINKLFNRETISYVIFGILTTLVDYAAFYIFHYKARWSEVLSNTIAWILAVAFAYITNKIFVFEAKTENIKALLMEIISFAGARVATLILTDVFLLFTKYIGMEAMIAKIIISVAVVIINYFLSKLFIFKKSNNKENHII